MTRVLQRDLSDGLIMVRCSAEARKSKFSSSGIFHLFHDRQEISYRLLFLWLSELRPIQGQVDLIQGLGMVPGQTKQRLLCPDTLTVASLATKYLP